MGSRNLVIVKEAQHIRKIDDLAAYLEQPQAATILVICYKYKTLDKRKTFSRVSQKSSAI